MKARMRLDWQPKSGLFTLHVPRAEANLQELMQDHGLDHSLSASTEQEAVLFTTEPYAAAAFVDMQRKRRTQSLRSFSARLKPPGPCSPSHIRGRIILSQTTSTPTHSN